MALGFIEMTLAENFCNGIPLGSTMRASSTTAARRSSRGRMPKLRRRAHAHRQRAGDPRLGDVDAISVAVRNASLITKARILVDKGQYAAAAALVPRVGIPDTYQYLFITQAASNSDDLGIWTLNNSVARMSVGDSVVNLRRQAVPDAERDSVRVAERSACSDSQGHRREDPGGRRRPDAAVHSADLQEPRRSDRDGLAASMLA